MRTVAALIAAVSLATLAWLATSCGNGERPTHGAPRSSPTKRGRHGTLHERGGIVARVDGVGIHRDEVEALARESGVEPRVALERLVERELLVGAAKRAGLDRDVLVRTEVRRATARALLAREVESLTEADVPAPMIAEAYARERRRFDAPELRSVVHVLGELPRNTKRAVGLAKSRAVVASLRDAMLEGTLEEIQALQATTRDGVQLRVEPVQRFARDDAYERAFLDAAFALAAPGDVSPPVETRYGWHVIRLTEILAPTSTPVAERDATLRRELLPAFRRRRAQELTREIETRVGVSRDEDTIRDALRRDPLEAAGGAPP